MSKKESLNAPRNNNNKNNQIVQEVSNNQMEEKKTGGLQQDLLENSFFISEVIDMMEEHVILQDLDGKVIRANMAAAASIGKNPKNIEGEYCYQLWNNKDERCEKCPVIKSIETGQITFEKITTDDNRVWFIKSRPVKNDSGIVIGAIEMTCDITEQVQAEEAIKKIRERDEAFLKAIPDVMFVLDKEGNFIDSESNTEKHFFAPIDKLPGKNIRNVLSPEVFEITQKNIQKALSEKNTQSFHFNISLDEEHKYYEARIAPFGENKLFMIIRNITLRKKAEYEVIENKQRFIEFADIIPQTIFETDKDLNIVYINQYGLESTGYSHDDINKTINISKLLLPDDPQQQQNGLITNKSNHSISPHEYSLVHKKGHSIPVLVYSRPIVNQKGFNGLRGIAVDITDRKKTEAELFQAKEKAEESDKLKSSFLSNMSHEVRTPLNGILGFAALLKEKETPKEERAKFIDIINERAKYLLDIINNIVELSKIDSKQLRINQEEILLKEFLPDMLKEFDQTKHETGKEHIKIILDKPKIQLKRKIKITTDPYKLKQIFKNIINNALKYTEKGHINIGYQPNKDESILFYVKDTGIGIPKDKQDIIFKRFRQGEEGYTKSFGGAGLGLALASELVGLLHGEIWVKSRENKGTTFYFTLNKKSLLKKTS